MEKLFMVLLGCTPPGRHTEQHDVFFGVARELKEMVEDFKTFWPEAQGRVHIDAWRQLTQLQGFAVEVTNARVSNTSAERLFFINLGGYKPGDFEEYHYKLVVVGKDRGEAIQKAKQTAFYQHMGFKGAESHVDDKYGVDVDDCYEIEDILPAAVKSAYSIVLKPNPDGTEDELQIGYIKLEKLINS